MIATKDSNELSTGQDKRRIVNTTQTTPFVGFDGLATFLPMYKPRTLRDHIKHGVIPTVRVGRKLAFHLPTVEAALMRRQREVR